MTNNERENFSNTKIATVPDSDMPVFSFSNSKNADKIVNESFNISGNKFSAFYDTDHKLVFVLDETLTENTPNILLIIADRAGRKWDDILGNDYKMDLEDIRPKKNNKYQKLDINYDGLPVYGQLIADYKTGGSIESALDNLTEFRAKVGQELAQARLNAAKREIETSTTTIKKTEETLVKLHSNTKALKTKMAKARSEVGKKPTKESAAKILKIQAQTEKINEKEKRARARLRRAKKRLEDARNDLQAALNALKATNKNNISDLPKIEIKSQEPKMADEPKPLFNKDPEIMDDKIAFQPIGFEPPAFNPTEFTTIETKPTQTPEPVVLPAPKLAEPVAVAPVINTTEPVAAPVTNNINITQQPTINIPQQPVAVPQQPIVNPQPVMERPSSPVLNPNVTVLKPSATSSKKPAMIYYVMLIVLIGLSILTLSIYQSRMDNSAKPNLEKVTVTESAPVNETQPIPGPQADESAFIATTPVVEQPQPVPVAVEEPTPAAIIEEPVSQPEPIAAPAPVEQPQPAPQPEPVAAVAPIIVPEPAPLETPEATLPLKPEYQVHGPANYEAEKTQQNSVSSQLCTSGTAPDEDGCCAGENLKFVESMNGYACCSVADGECYPPLK